MPQYLLPKSDRDIIFAAWAKHLCITLRKLDETPIPFDGGSWVRYECQRNDAQAIIAIAEHSQYKDKILISVSTDLRRLWRLKNIWRDMKLVREIAAVLRHMGGYALED